MTQGDYTYDGRVRIGELQLIAYADPAAIFNYSGALTVGMDAFVKVTVGVGWFKFTLVDKTFELFNEVIYDFNIYQLEDSKVLAGERLNAPVIGNVDGNGTLALYMGETAQLARAYVSRPKNRRQRDPGIIFHHVAGPHRRGQSQWGRNVRGHLSGVGARNRPRHR